MFSSGVDLLQSMSEIQSTHPLAETAVYSEYILCPGEMLFIPRWHWHFIMSIDRDTALRWHNENRNYTGQDDLNNNDAVQFDNAAEIKGCKTSLPFSGSVRDNYSFSVSLWWGKRILL